MAKNQAKGEGDRGGCCQTFFEKKIKNVLFA